MEPTAKRKPMAKLMPRRPCLLRSRREADAFKGILRSPSNSPPRYATVAMSHDYEEQETVGPEEQQQRHQSDEEMQHHHQHQQHQQGVDNNVEMEMDTVSDSASWQKSSWWTGSSSTTGSSWTGSSWTDSSSWWTDSSSWAGSPS
eukprot:TRINITY_DN49922_c0_g1_i1.p2 TRINITY_DN49922_c0_g1~~TRINITY_DN49922_c0_g1_i1.p2  ORF type:complete len:145 (+),score=42.25 TRINITY_DN49922_c0_g1_i1:79-513(+)